MKKTQPNTAPVPVVMVRFAVYTRKSTEEGLNQEFNSLDAQRESAEAYIASQRAEGWICLPEHFDDGGCTGANLDRPALQRLLAAIAAGQVDCVVVYKVDRLSRSLLDFARLMETFEKHQVAFVSVTQHVLKHVAPQNGPGVPVQRSRTASRVGTVRKLLRNSVVPLASIRPAMVRMAWEGKNCHASDGLNSLATIFRSVAGSFSWSA